MKTEKKLQKSCKNKGFKGFRFTLSSSKVPKKNKELEAFDTSIYSNLLKVRNVYLEYNSISNYINLIYKDISINPKWYDYSKSLSFIYDHLSINFYMKGAFEVGTKAFHDSVDLLEDMFFTYLKEDLGKKRVSRKLVNTVCKWFCYGVYRCGHLNKCAGTYTRTKENFNSNRSSISYKVTIELISFLEKINYIIPLKGYNYDGYSKVNSVFILNPDIWEFLGYEEPSDSACFKMQGKPDQLVEVRYKEEGSKTNIIMEEDMYEDDWYNPIDTASEVLDQFGKMINESMISVMGIDIPELWFRRIFKNTVYEFGRIFDNGEIQTKTKYYRSLIEIDGMKTVSLDIKSLHPRMIMEMKGIVCPEDYDPYISDGVSLDEKLIKRFKKFYGIDKYNPIRNLSKITLLCLINSKSESEAVKAIRDKIYKDNLKKGTRNEDQLLYVGLPENVLSDSFLLEWIEKIKNHNHKISDWLGSGKSGELQFKDSEIMLACIKQLVEKGIVALPVHDALICAVNQQDIVSQIMKTAYKEVMGSDFNILIEEE